MFKLFVNLVLLTSACGCNQTSPQATSTAATSTAATSTAATSTAATSTAAKVTSANSKDIKTYPPNEFGFAKISAREGDAYQEGIIDKQGRAIVPLSPHLLVDDITAQMALIRMERKFLFVPLDKGPFTSGEIAEVEGFQYAQPYRCGFALVTMDDVWFYINPDGDRAFNNQYDFAETFHHDRALVCTKDRHQIIDTSGNIVAELTYDQVSPQSPWCWQVTNQQDDRYLSGFVGLNGQLLAELIYENVGYYQPDVKRIPVTLNGRHGFLDEQAQVAIPLVYQYAEIFDRGKARVMRDGRTFFIDPDGNEVPD